MGKRVAKKRTIYDNYNLWDDYAEDEEILSLESDNEKWEMIYELDRLNWASEHEMLNKFFDGNGPWILQGYTGLWTGRARGGFIFKTFDEMFLKATVDCDFWHFYDANGHFFLKCSHHDGSNIYEIRKLTEKGIAYYEKWEDQWWDSRTEEYIHDMIIKHYSVLPNYACEVFGCPKVEYEKKSTLVA